jgi:NADH-quinone oxidoreductase subunit N
MAPVIIDFNNSAHYALALLPEIVLSAWAMLVLLVDVFQKGSRQVPSSSWMGPLTLAGVVLAGIANGWLLTAREASADGMIAVDGFRVFANYLFLLAVAFFVLTSERYLNQERMRLGELHVLVMFAAVGMMVFAGARELMVIFIALELMSVPVYVLTGSNRRDARSAEGALKYFLLGAFSSAIFLFGIALTYGATGSTNLAAIARAIGTDGVGANAMILAGVALLGVGFGFKIAAVPFHMWTPDAYDGAPAPITGFMAGAIKAAAFAAFARVFLTAFPALYDSWDAIAIWLAVLTMITANLVALVEGNVKRMLAYSSIAHAGYLLVAIAAASTLGSASMLFYLLVYTLMTMGAFAVVMIVAGDGERHVNLEAYQGLGWQRPLLGVAMTVFMLSLAGFPFTGGFIGKVFILRAAVEKGLVALAVVLVLASLVSYFYYLRVVWYMWFREAEEATVTSQPTLATGLRVALAVAVVGLLITGIFPGQMLDIAESSAATLTRPQDAVFGLGR